MKNKLNDDEFYDDVEVREIDFTETDLLGEDTKKSKKRRKRFKIFLIVLVIFLIGIYIFGLFFYQTHFFPGTNIDGISVSNCTDESAQIKINNTTSSREVTIMGEDDLSSTITANEINLKFDNLEILNNILMNQKVLIWPIDILKVSENDFTTDYTYNQDLLNNIVNNLPLVTNPNIVEPVNAQIDYNGEEYFIQPSVPGDKPNVTKLKDAIINALLHNKEELNLERDNLYVKPSIIESDEAIQDDLDELNKVIQANITINFPDQPTVLNKDTFHEWLSINDGQVVINNEDLTNYVAGLADQFNTQGKSYSFRTHGGSYINLISNSGYLLNQPEMIKKLNEQILKGEVQAEDPIWEQSEGPYLSGDEITNNYIEVSIQTQKVWLYHNGSEVTSSNMVSGDVSRGTQTVTGLYFVSSKTTNETIDVTMPNGTHSSQQVSYYVSYGTNRGFVSAPWRTDFGGNIYLRNGTSGFIAVPNDIAQTIYNTVDNNYPIVIY